jgi:hypothetical protein
MTGNAGAPIPAETLKKWVPRIERAIGTKGARNAGGVWIFFHVRDMRTGGGYLNGSDKETESRKQKPLSFIHEIILPQALTFSDAKFNSRFGEKCNENIRMMRSA